MSLHRTVLYFGKAHRRSPCQICGGSKARWSCVRSGKMGSSRCSCTFCRLWEKSQSRQSRRRCLSQLLPRLPASTGSLRTHLATEELANTCLSTYIQVCGNYPQHLSPICGQHRSRIWKLKGTKQATLSLKEGLGLPT